jgi:hypothetical protein
VPVRTSDVIVHNAWALQMFANMTQGIPASVPAPTDGLLHFAGRDLGWRDHRGRVRSDDD